MNSIPAFSATYEDVVNSGQFLSHATPNVYGISKVAAYLLMRHYREAASAVHEWCGIL